MKIAVVMPCPWMHFSPTQATSSELTVHDILVNLPPSDRATVYAQEVRAPYTDLDIQFFPRQHKRDQRLLPQRIARALTADNPDVIVVQQHLPTAVSLRRFLPHTPILLHRHNDYDPPHQNAIRRWVQTRRFKAVNGIAFVSAHSRQKFLNDWQKYVTCPTSVVPNGMDLTIWAPVPAAQRRNEIVFVGRAIPEKGGLELARALGDVLPRYPHFRTRFIFGAPDTHPDYREQVEKILAPLGDQVRVERQIAWGDIRAAFEHAAIAVVPSVWAEPFGRTALEAMAGGAALISSTRGGLDEVVGDAAVRLNPVTPETIAEALTDLIEHPDMRAALSARGLKQVQKYTIGAQVAAFLWACQTVLKGVEPMRFVAKAALPP